MIEFCCSLLFFISIMMILETRTTRKVFGIILLSASINMFILLSGRIEATKAAFVGGSNAPTLALYANPLPQALILTAIVISFSLLAWICILLKACYQKSNRSRDA